MYVNESNVVYENEIAQLTFALVKAANDRDAIDIAKRMVTEQRNQQHLLPQLCRVASSSRHTERYAPSGT